jgi:hypothetical protein
MKMGVTNMLGLILLVMFFALLIGIFVRLRKSPLDKIATLASIEAAVQATPQNSEARKLLAEELARPKRRQAWAILIAAFLFFVYVIGHISGVPRPDSRVSSSSSTNTTIDLPPPSRAPLLCGTAGSCR